jgi:hypothetical protein
MTMGMVHVRNVWVGVLHRLMLVRMSVRLARRIERIVRMTVVFIMHMRMRVGHRSMAVLMFMMLQGQNNPSVARQQRAVDQVAQGRVATRARHQQQSTTVELWSGR